MLHEFKKLEAFYKFTHFEQKMRWIHRATITVFSKPEENEKPIKEGLISLVPFSLEEAKIKIEEQKTEGFNERTIRIYKITITKESHTNDFLQFLLDKLTEEQKQTLINQIESRIDTEYDYFIRIDKDKWMNEKEIELTDTGNCYHIKLSIAVYPKNKEKAIQLIEKLFRQKSI